MQDQQIHHEHLLAAFERSGEFVRLRGALSGGEGPLGVYGLEESAALLMLCALLRHEEGTLLVCEDLIAARRVYEGMAAMFGGVRLLPHREVSFTAAYASRELTAQRIDALSHAQGIVVTTIEALMQPTAPPEVFRAQQFSIAVGDTFDLGALAQRLTEAGYERTDKVEAPGEFRSSGGIVDIYPLSGDAVRIEFFDDEIDSLRSFDPLTQRSIAKLTSVVIPPATEAPLTAEAAQRREKLLAQLSKANAPLAEQLSTGSAACMLHALYGRHTALEYLAPGTPIVLVEPARLQERAQQSHEHFVDYAAQSIEDGTAAPFMAEQLIDAQAVFALLSTPHTLMLSALMRTLAVAPRAMFRFDASSSEYHANLQALADDIALYKRKDYAVLLYAGARADSLYEQLTSLGVPLARADALTRPPVAGEVLLLAQQLPFGAQLRDMALAVFSESDIYGTRKRTTRIRRRSAAGKLDVFAQLKVGDYIVHDTHGIGIFKGVSKLIIEGNERDFLQIQYQGSDTLYVPAEQFDRVQKYVGGEGHVPKLSKMGGGDWNRAVKRARESVKALSFDLAALYAKRMGKRGFAFSPDTAWQRELEDSFEYEETPDQLTSLAEIKRDMESERVMDRLLCGDVGYGKTEVALRAAFKALQDGKQVAFLVPTTILAQQHYQTLMQRFARFPVTVGVLSRFKSAGEQGQLLKQLKEGAIDVIVGTHRLLSKDVRFKDLGLLIVDEEQRFGVGHKEIIKTINEHVDVLSLSATPIPRTLHMSMLGIRDISVIETPPEERFPVQTFVSEYAPSAVREALLREVERGGQAYVVYNRVSNMETFTAELANLVPEARFGYAHGQMNETALERRMLDFLEREFDVLVCSTIIESGLDIPNVNTILIYDADRFGLSQLYQLRGRVGRSARLGYAYLMFRRDKVLTEVAAKRLRAIREFTELGAGFKIALRDLEIRGAGNLLGPEQHGFMSEVGYDYYIRLVEEAMREVKGEAPVLKAETQLDIPIAASIPEGYIREAQRLEMYKRIAAIDSIEAMYDVQEELEDRFGDIPLPVQNLMDVALLKSAAEAAMIANVTVRTGVVTLRVAPSLADIDGEAFVALMGEYAGIATLMQQKPVITLRQKGKTVDEMMKIALEFIQKLFICIRPPQQV